MKKLVKKLSDSIFGNTCIEYVLDENHNYKEQYNANKDLFIYINGIQVGSISPGELQELQYRVFYSSSLWWSYTRIFIETRNNCAYCPAAGGLAFTVVEHRQS
ncbi:TPA: hypothetical protein ACJYIZ_000061 [Neisseria gonorrhoeae]